MIRSFADAETRKIGEGKRSRYLPPDIQRVAARKLANLDAAISLASLAAIPGHRLEALKGGRAGQHSIRINQQWRVGFVWTTAGTGSG